MVLAYPEISATSRPDFEIANKSPILDPKRLLGPLACSPKPDPSVMRVSTAQVGKSAFGGSMKGKRHRPGQIIRKLREADGLLAEGKMIAEVCQRLQSSDSRVITGDGGAGGG